MQQYADIYLLQRPDQFTLEGSSCTNIMTCTGGCDYRFSTPDDGCCDTRNMSSDFAVNKYLHTGLIRPRWRAVAVPVLWPVPEAAVTDFSTPDDGYCDTRNMYSDFAVYKYLYTGLIRPRWRAVAVPELWSVPEAAVTVFSTPDDGCCDTRNM
jgi:hypothetical protein